MASKGAKKKKGLYFLFMQGTPFSKRTFFWCKELLLVKGLYFLCCSFSHQTIFIIFCSDNSKSPNNFLNDPLPSKRGAKKLLQWTGYSFWPQFFSQNNFPDGLLRKLLDGIRWWSGQSDARRSLFTHSCWLIWKWRNSFIFQDAIRPVSALLSIVKASQLLWANSTMNLLQPSSPVGTGIRLLSVFLSVILSSFLMFRSCW